MGKQVRRSGAMPARSRVGVAKKAGKLAGKAVSAAATGGVARAAKSRKTQVKGEIGARQVEPSSTSKASKKVRVRIGNVVLNATRVEAKERESGGVVIGDLSRRLSDRRGKFCTLTRSKKKFLLKGGKGRKRSVVFFYDHKKRNISREFCEVGEQKMVRTGSMAKYVVVMTDVVAERMAGDGDKKFRLMK